MAAIDGGRVVDTSMGLSPLDGLVMGTRCGDIDPAIVLHLASRRHFSINDIDALLNKRSGLLGLSESSNDVRDLLRKRRDGDEKAGRALEIFCYRAKKYIGAYTAVLGGLDALVFTAGIGENAPDIRTWICEGLSHLGVRLDPNKNQEAVSVEASIGRQGAPAAIFVIPTNEERQVAEEAFGLARSLTGQNRCLQVSVSEQ